MGEADVQDAVGRVLVVLREAGRAERTVRCQQVVLDRFVAFLGGRGLSVVSERVCIDFVENQTGVRLGSLRESVNDRRFVGRWCCSRTCWPAGRSRSIGR